MRTIQVTCPECIERANGYVITAGKSADHLYWEVKKRNTLILARDTSAVLVKPWRQNNKKRTAVWKKQHKLKLQNLDIGLLHDTIWHIGVANTDNTAATPLPLCQTPSDVVILDGPGAEIQIAQDAIAVEGRDAREYHAQYEKARLDAMDREIRLICKQLQATFESLGYDVTTSKSPTLSPCSSRISISPQDAAKLLAALGSPTPHCDVSPMPVWEVRYGDSPDEDSDPLLLGARTESAVRAHVITHYYDERHEDEPNTPLNIEKLHIKRLAEPSKPDPKEDAA